MDVIPPLLKHKKFNELLAMNGGLGVYHKWQKNGFNMSRDLSKKCPGLKAFFRS